MKSRSDETLEYILEQMNELYVERMSPVTYKKYVTGLLNELDAEDLNEVVSDMDHNIVCANSTGIDKLTEQIDQWHKDRKITINGNSVTQFGKLIEEASELLLAIQRKDYYEVKDALGDLYVVMVAIAKLEGTTMSDCIEQAYNEIKDRTGHLDESGNFIKNKESE